MIEFRGKAGWSNLRNGVKTKIEEPVSKESNSVPLPSNHSTVLDGTDIGHMYGRQRFTEREMEALELGGASEAPSVKSGSTGAIFGI